MRSRRLKRGLILAVVMLAVSALPVPGGGDVPVWAQANPFDTWASSYFTGGSSPTGAAYGSPFGGADAACVGPWCPRGAPSGANVAQASTTSDFGGRRGWVKPVGAAPVVVAVPPDWSRPETDAAWTFAVAFRTPATGVTQTTRLGRHYVIDEYGYGRLDRFFSVTPNGLMVESGATWHFPGTARGGAGAVHLAVFSYTNGLAGGPGTMRAWLDGAPLGSQSNQATASGYNTFGGGYTSMFPDGASDGWTLGNSVFTSATISDAQVTSLYSATVNPAGTGSSVITANLLDSWAAGYASALAPADYGALFASPMGGTRFVCTGLRCAQPGAAPTEASTGPVSAGRVGWSPTVSTQVTMPIPDWTRPEARAAWSFAVAYQAPSGASDATLMHHFITDEYGYRRNGMWAQVTPTAVLLVFGTSWTFPTTTALTPGRTHVLVYSYSNGDPGGPGTLTVWLDGVSLGSQQGYSAGGYNCCPGNGETYQYSAPGWAIGASLYSTAPLTDSQAGTLSNLMGDGTAPPVPSGVPAKSHVGWFAAGRMKFISRTRIDPVDTTTGAFVHRATDLQMTGRGVGFSFDRSYDSTSSGTSALRDWWHSYAESVKVDAATGVASYQMGNGSVVDYAPNGAGGFVTPAFMRSSLRAVSAGGWEVVDVDGTVTRFNAAGQMAAKVDRSGQGLSFAYDAIGRLLSATDASGGVFTFTYFDTGRRSDLLRFVTGPDGRRAVYAYTPGPAKPQLASVTTPGSRTTTYTYDSVGRLLSETDPTGKVQFTNTYDSQGRVVAQADALGNVSTFTWSAGGAASMTDATGAVFTDSSHDGLLLGSVEPNGSSTITYSPKLDITGYRDATGAQWTATYDARGNMTSRTAPSPISTVESWTYNATDQPLTSTDARGNTTSFVYDTAGRLLTETRPGGILSSYTWNSNGTMATSIDPRGGVTTYSYDAAGHVLSSTSPTGAVTSYTYDDAGRVTSVVDPRGNVAGANPLQYDTRYTYNQAGDLLTITNPLGARTLNTYDPAGNRVSMKAPDGGVTSYTYNNAIELVSETAPDGGVTSYVYNARGERVSQTDAVGGVTTWTYDPAGRMVSMVEPRGNVGGANPADFTWIYAYDGIGRRTQQTDPLGRITTWVYDALGRITGSTDPAGSTSTAFDGNGNVVSSTRSGIGTTSSTFDALNRVVTSTNARGKTTTFAYDPNGNQTQVTSPLGFSTTHMFDASNRETSMVEARGNAAGGTPSQYTWTYGYDITGNRTTVTDPNTNTVTTAYDRAGNVDFVVDARGIKTNYTYDQLNRVKQVNRPASGATKYVYDTMGRLRTRTDARLNTTSWDYDLGGRLMKQTDPLGRFFTYNYDIAGNRLATIDAVANTAGNPALGTTTYTYDRLGRRTKTSYSDGTPTVDLSYDTAGRVVSMTDGSGTTSYAYDTGSRLTTVTKGADTFTYAYNAVSDVTSRTYPDGTQIGYNFDDDERLAAVTKGAETTNYTYTPSGQWSGMTLPNGVTQNRSIDPAGRLNSILTVGPASNVIRSTVYNRDPNGNPVAIDVTGPAGTIPGESQRLTYDNSDRLTKACYTNTTCTGQNQTVWNYDLVGNRESEKIGSATITTAVFDAADELVSTTQGATVTPFAYNANGDQIQTGATTATYNTAHQTTSLTTGAATTTYTYDGNANRTTASNTTGTTRYVWDTNGGLPNVALERNTTGGLVRRYVYGNEIISADQPTGTSFYTADGLGTVTNITSSTAAIQATYTYTPFGVERTTNIADPNLTTNPIRYTGQYLDPTNQYQQRARYYRPNQGRFTQTDPAPLGAGSVFESSYVYGSNRPTVMVDPSGLRGSAAGRPANPVARVDPTQVPDELALREQCTGTAHDQFVCALWGVWRGADRDFGAFLSTAGTSLGGVTLVRYPNRFRRIPPPGVVLGESGWNRELIDGDGSPARHFIGFVAVAFSWGSTAAATGLERNESGGPGSTEQDRQSGYYAIALAARAGGADYYTDSQFGGFIRNLKSLTGAQAGPVGPGRPGLPPRRTGGEYIRHANRLMGG